MEDLGTRSIELEEPEDSGEGSEQGEDYSKALNRVLDDLSMAERFHEENRGKWTKFRNKYNCVLDGNVKSKNLNEIFDPETFAAIETITPRIQNAIFGGPEVWTVKPTGDEDVEKARKNEILLNYQSDRMDMYTVSGEVIRDGLVYGTGFSKLYWCRDFEPVITIESTPYIDPEGNVAEYTHYKKGFSAVYDGPKNERIAIDDLFIDPNATKLSNARFVIHRTWRTLDYLKKKQLEGVYENIDSIKPMATTAVYEESGKPKKEQSSDKLAQEVEVLEFFGQFDIDNDGYLESCIITVANRSTVIRQKMNMLPGAGYPFFSFCPIPTSGSVYGMSILEPIDKIQDALNKRTNQIADNIDLIINKMWKINRYAGIDEDQLVSAAGGFVEVNSMTDLEPIETPDIVPSVSMEVARFENKIQKALGTYDVARGELPNRQETATTTIALQNVAEIRFKTMALTFDRTYLRNLGKYQLRLNKKYMSPQMQIRIMNNDALYLEGNEQGFATITKEDILEDPDIMAVGATTEVGFSKEAQLRQIAQFLQITSNPVFHQNPMYSIDYSAVLERLPYLLNIKLRRPLVISVNPVMAYQQMAGQEQMANQLAMQGIQSGLSPEDMAMMMSGMPIPSRVKGELQKGVHGGQEESEDGGMNG